MNKKVRKQYRKYFFLKLLFTFLYYLSLYLPIAIFTFVNRAKYFYHYEGIKVGIGAIFAIVLIIVFTKKDFPFFVKAWKSKHKHIYFTCNLEFDVCPFLSLAPSSKLRDYRASMLSQFSFCYYLNIRTTWTPGR